MGFWSACKSFLGFGGATFDADYELYSDTAAPCAVASEVAAQMPEPEPVAVSPEMRDAIFARVLDVFNAALPDFLSRSVDPDAQRRLLVESLDAGMKEYLDSLSDSVLKYHENLWNRRQASMAAELEQIRTRSAEVEQQASALKEKQLSAERQKRTMSERIHDLEKQCDALQADREQFQLENRSLMSRLKAAGVHAEDVETLRAEVADLNARLNEVYNKPDSALARVRESLNNELAKAREGCDALKEQLRVSTEMFDDMRRRNATASSTIAERDAEISRLNALIESHRSDLQSSTDRYEKKIGNLESLLDDRSAQIESLRATVAENLRLQALREEELQREISSLRPPTVVSEMTIDFGATRDSSPRISDDDISALKETFENDDWFTSSPPPNTPSMRPPKDASDFGYTAPARRKSQPENPAQLSLF